ncbi:hypothetical protein [Roseinatronobacter monicus]|uniref:Uncharacterized protein n=1 Tax=Roseinatronobacter monicus TaxID=393481 RepID=A0A543K3C4_9RHOB|nr:hypothetical protein [Roseinatronobacter monicus]TQM89555.1 hypothetical protein BD293_4577 [Roseinatronobacter monicus]
MGYETDKTRQNRQNVEGMTDAAIKALTLFGFAGAIFTIALIVSNSADHWVAKTAAVITVLSSVLVATIGFMNTVYVMMSFEKVILPDTASQRLKDGIAWAFAVVITASIAAATIAAALQFQ